MELAPATDVGHMHLQVADLERSRRFYQDLLGLEVTQANYPGALFLAADGYHHHVGLNVWAGKGAPPPPARAVGLVSFGFRIPDQATWEETVQRLRQAGVPIETRTHPQTGESLFVRDPDGIGVELVR